MSELDKFRVSTRVHITHLRRCGWAVSLHRNTFSVDQKFRKIPLDRTEREQGKRS